MRAVEMGDADTGRTDRVVESCMAVRARALQLVLVVVAAWRGAGAIMSCEGSATSGDLRTYILKTTRRNREVCPPEFHDDDVEPGPS